MHPEFLRLLTESPRLWSKSTALIGRPAGSFYTQVASRTPSEGATPRAAVAEADGGGEGSVRPRDDRGGREYHLDGQANASGARFPDHFSLLLGVAIASPGFPGDDEEEEEAAADGEEDGEEAGKEAGEMFNEDDDDDDEEDRALSGEAEDDDLRRRSSSRKGPPGRRRP